MTKSIYRPYFNHFLSISLCLFIAAFLCTLPCSVSHAAKTKSKKAGPPIHIKSDTMEAMDKTGTVVFKGNVVAVRGDLTINADTLKVIYANIPDKKQGEGKKRRVLKKIVATGHVKVIQGKKVGTGKQAIYDKRAEKLTLSGDAQVWEGSNRIRGTKITLYINENRSVVESSGRQKVEATVYAD